MSVGLQSHEGIRLAEECALLRRGATVDEITDSAIAAMKDVIAAWTELLQKAEQIRNSNQKQEAGASPAPSCTSVVPS